MLACIGQFYLSAILGNVLFDIEPAWAISEYCCAFFGYIDTLPLRLCLIDIVCFDNAETVLCLLWLYRHFASWAALPLGLLCLLGCFASWDALTRALLGKPLSMGPLFMEHYVSVLHR
jgi:hypothetical protein